MAATITPAATTPQHLRGVELHHRREYRQAIEQFQQSLRTVETAGCWSDLGCAQFAVGQVDDAERSFRRAIELDKTCVLAVRNLATLLATTNRSEEALRLLNLAQHPPKAQQVGLQTPPLRHRVQESRALTLPAFQPGTRAPRILCLVERFLEHGLSEANAREGWTLFESLRTPDSKVDASFASIESTVAKSHFDLHRGIHAVPRGEIANFVRDRSPDILQVHYPFISFPIDFGLSHQPTVLTVTCADPLFGCRPEALDEIRHLIDFGRLTLICQSSAGLDRLRKNGVRVEALIPPVMAAPLRRISVEKKLADFVIGFATAPLVAPHWETRGVPLLLELASMSPDVQFLLAWRTEPGEIQKAVADKGLKNVTVLAGHLDMEIFYAHVDAMILPFGAAWGNHGCPLSAVEGMLRGKPVLATDSVGIAGWLRQSGAGVVTQPTREALRAGLVQLQRELKEFSREAQIAAQSSFDRETVVNAYRLVHLRSLRKQKGPTLTDWQNRVASAGNRLARGRASLGEYYQPRATAQQYIENRFVAPEFKKFDEQEREAIKYLIESQFSGRNDLILLDLATGPGRLLPCLIPFGSATALDGSEQMLDVARQKNPLGVRFVHGDVFSHPLNEKFHVVTCGRLLRHFEYPDRRLFYRRFHELLRDDGMAIVDVPNPAPEYAMRDRTGWENYPVYDIFWTLGEFRNELHENGLELVSFSSVGHHLSPATAQSDQAEPFEYVVAFSKRSA
jgi:glycosyltransferase involved in cell wall biosynthesis